MKQLGKGGQAEVFKCKLKEIPGRFVDKNKKVFNNEVLAEEVLNEMFSEFYIAKDLDHPHIIEYKYFMKSYSEKTKFHEFHILMEYLDGGDMEDFLKEVGPPTSLSWLRVISQQILSALVYLHEERKIIHQDLKPCNILFTSKKRDAVKLIDLGVSS